MEFQPKAFLAPQYAIKAAVAPWERQGAEALRRQTFCDEQKIFQNHDRDKVDDYALPLVAVSMMAGDCDEVVGTVRIHREGKREWWGSRLAVAHSHRRVGRLGAELIRLAVSTANGIGCDVFYAHVQKQNVRLFQRLHWQLLEEMDIHGKPHAKMQADLAYYPAFKAPECGWVTPLRPR